jgi:Arc/MetJ family transcription regulator
MITEAIKYMHLEEDAKAVGKHLRAIVDPKTTEEQKAELQFRVALRLSRLEHEMKLIRNALTQGKEKEDE